MQAERGAASLHAASDRDRLVVRYIEIEVVLGERRLQRGSKCPSGCNIEIPETYVTEGSEQQLTTARRCSCRVLDR